jgi:gamma-glutamyl-gamma-aminobutyrate hydrolase PuuD
MVSVQSYGVRRDDLGTVIAALITRQQSSFLPPRYRPLIGMLATSSSSGARGQGGVMATDAACIEAILSSGGDVRLIPVQQPQPPYADAFAAVLDTVLTFDGLLFTGSSDDMATRVDGQNQWSKGVDSSSLVNWWVMLMTLMARQTMTPLFAIGPDAASVNLALGGTLQQDVVGQRDERADASLNNWQTHPLDLDLAKLAHCTRGGSFSGDGSDPLERTAFAYEAIEVCCRTHTHVVATLAPDWQAWGWHNGLLEGFGYSGPSPWWAVATLFHPEARPQDMLSRSLFSRYLQASRAYAGSLRAVLKSTRMRDKLLRALYFDPLAQPLLSNPLHSL